MTLTFKQKIIGSMVLVGALPLTLISAVLIGMNFVSGSHGALDQLDVAHENIGGAVEDYMHGLDSHVKVLAENPEVLDSLEAFSAAWKSPDLAAVQVDDKGIAERYRYQRENTPGATAADEETWTMKGQAQRALQYLYIVKNENKYGEKHKLDYQTDGTTFSAVHKKYHPYLRAVLEEYGLYDIFLVNTDGDVVYTVFKEVDFTSNLLSGPYAGTGLGKAVQQALKGKEGEVYSADFEPYAPSYNAQAGFLAAPLLKDGKVIGAVAVQMPLDKLDKLMEMMKSNFGEVEGDALLLGTDWKLRTDSVVNRDLMKVGVELPKEIQNTIASGWKDEWTGTFTDVNGHEVFARFRKLAVPGFEWGMMVKGSKSLMLAEIYHQLWIALGILLVVVAVVTGLALWMSRVLSAPVQVLAKSFFHGAERVASTTGQVSEAVSSMVAASEETSAQTVVVRRASNEAAGYVSSVSTAVSELNVSINDISHSIGETNVLIDDAVTKAQKTDEVVRSLGEASKKITEVVSLINDLAEQTNLLALNAAIEAARAGDAGRGFAVVADEVKKLASHTSQATVDIKEQVSEIQTVSEQSVVALHAVVDAIHKIRDNATTVSAAVEEQSGVAKQIAGSVQEAANRVQMVDENMNGIEQAANDTGVAADQVSGSSQEVQGAFGEMKSQVQKVLDDMGINA